MIWTFHGDLELRNCKDDQSFKVRVIHSWFILKSKNKSQASIQIFKTWSFKNIQGSFKFPPSIKRDSIVIKIQAISSYKPSISPILAQHHHLKVSKSHGHLHHKSLHHFKYFPRLHSCHILIHQNFFTRKH